MNLKIFPLVAAAWLLLCSSDVLSLELKKHPKLQAIADQLVAEEIYSQAELESIFADVEVKQPILDAMMNPAEYRLTWGKYRKIFLGEERIQQGVEFWNEYQADLERAEKEYGVPASVIVSILGVETKFGRIKGKHRVLDSLSTLVVGFPRRSKFFGKELREFLILTKENDMNPTEIVGSYAGAVGYPQFISSSYRHYAVDFSGDGKADLINQPIDAIGSVANYFVKNGWKPGEPVTSRAHQAAPAAIVELANRKRKTKFSAGELRAKGAAIDAQIADDETLNVLMLDASEIVPDSKDKDYYIVRAGDTACEIAEKHSVPCKALFQLNKLNDKGSIYRGQRLRLPVSAAVRSKPAADSDRNQGSKWTLSSGAGPTQATPDQSMPRYFFTHDNFYAITQYNHSVLYAMAVYDLSIEIARAKRAQARL